MAAPYPLSILHTTTPGAQELSMPKRGVKPFMWQPYPTDVGTPMGMLTNPLRRLPVLPPFSDTDDDFVRSDFVNAP